MFSAWNFSEWIHSIISAAFIFSVLTGLSVLLAKTVVKKLRDEAEPVAAFPARQSDSRSYLQKAA